MIAACVAMSACGGGNSESSSKPTAAVVPSGQTATQESGAASGAQAEAAASAATQDTQATQTASTAASSTAGASSQVATTATTATGAQSTVSGGKATAPKSDTTVVTTGTSGGSTGTSGSAGTGQQSTGNNSATAGTTSDATPVVVAEAPQAKPLADTTSGSPPARCTVGETRTFGACKAFASIGISHGETVSFWNVNTNATGTIAASCSNGVVTWQPGVCSETTQAQGLMAAGADAKTSTQAAAVAAPVLSSLQTFVATPPYSVLSLSGAKAVPLIPYGGKQEVARTHDFVSAFVNPVNQRPNAFSVQAPIVVGGSLQYINLHEASTPPLAAQGSPGRASIEGGALKLAYLPNDPPSSEKLRTQVNSYPIPTRRTLTWDLSFKFGGDQAGETWPTVKYTTSPVLIWQVIQNTRGYPPLVLLVDTDPADSNKLMLVLAWRGANTLNYTNRWTVASINKNQYYDLVIQANLDEREPQAGGRGVLRMWVNGKLAADLNQRTLFSDLDDTYRWVIAVYQTNEAAPINLTRVMKWRRARMMVSP